MVYNATVETFRDEEYPMLEGKVYLDHSGTTLYSKSLVNRISETLLCNLYGNPHSDSDPAKLSGNVVEEIRLSALAFFNADPEHFDLIFTANATAAIKLVGESFQDLAAAGSATGGFFYGYHRDAHSSLVGVRELTGGSHHCFASDAEVEAWLSGHCDGLREPNLARLPSLFAYPGQSNMNGRRLPLAWTKKLRQSTKPHHQNTYSLLDAAALATTTQIDLSDPAAAPDFTAVSFYKIFGLPDLGGLIVRKESGHILSWRRYFGGGTINLLTVLHQPTVQRKDGSLHEALEDGTLPFHNIMMLGCAIEVHKKLYGSMTAISQHTSYLARRLYMGLASLQHSNGRPVCIIYVESQGSPYQDSKTQGATVAFSVVRQDGSYISHAVVEKLANEKQIFVRSGGLCNPGGITRFLQIEHWQFSRNWSSGFRCGGEENMTDVISGKPTGVVRASLGAMSTLADVDTFLEFMAATFESRLEISKAIGRVSIDLPQEDAGTADQSLVYGEYSLPSSESAYNSRSETLNPPPTPPPILAPGFKTATSLSNFEYRERAQQLHTRQSQESFPAVNNAKRRPERMALPVPIQKAFSDPTVPRDGLYHEDNYDLRTSKEHGGEERPSRGGKFRFWRSKRSRGQLVHTS